jgi:hypothetical protein
VRRGKGAVEGSRGGAMVRGALVERAAVGRWDLMWRVGLKGVGGRGRAVERGRILFEEWDRCGGFAEAGDCFRGLISARFINSD